MEGEFTTFAPAAGEGSKGIPPEYQYSNVKMAGRLAQAIGAGFASVAELDVLVGKRLAVSGQGRRAGCGSLVGASWRFSLPFPCGVCFIRVCPVSLIMVPPPPHSILALAASAGPSPRAMSKTRRSSYDYVHSKDYKLEKEQKQRVMVDIEGRLFWEGMLSLMRLECKRNNHLDFRELTVEKGRVHYCCNNLN
jgi:hypothetical protein